MLLGTGCFYVFPYQGAMENTPPNLVFPIYGDTDEPVTFKLTSERNTALVSAEDADDDRLEFFWQIPQTWEATTATYRDADTDTGVLPLWYSTATIERDESLHDQEFSVFVTDREDSVEVRWVVKVWDE